MLRIAEHWHGSDLGRQRQGNEDNYFVRAPLFVVADGMGGAQAGEVASEMAVASFAEGLPDGSPGEALVKVIGEANHRIHERSRSEEHRAGMGTTLTAAYVGEADVTIAHVGDSRAYLWRGGDLIRLTRDHSLVGELVARGKLTEEQAEAHPQRSVITRALGPEPSVEVDLDVYGARTGDVFLLCSDGLTSMVHEAQLKPILESADGLASAGLESAGRALIAAANQAGGRDNITVILFRLEEVDARSGAQGDASTGQERDGVTTEYATFEGEAVTSPRQGVTRPEGPADAVQAGDDQEAEYRRSATVALSAVRPHAEAAPKRTAPLPEADRRNTRRSAPGRRRRRIPGGVILTAALVAIVLAAGWTASRVVYFVGTDEQRANAVTIYRGLPVDLPLGVRLYERYRISGVTLQSVPPSRREVFTNHKLRSKDDAENLVIQLERGQLES